MVAIPGQPQKQFAHIVAKTWADEAFKARFLSEPVQVLKEHGIDVRDGVEVRVVENTKDVVHIVLPARPEQELTEEQLEGLSGGMCLMPTLCGCECD